MLSPLNRIIIYAKEVEETVDFYERHFGFKAIRQEGDRIVELVGPAGGAIIMVHPAAKGQRVGQSIVKLVFDVEDVEVFCAQCAENGLVFGSLHHADGYVYANVQDPCRNSVSVSSRAFRSDIVL